MTQDRKNTDYYKLYEQRRRQESPRKKRIKKILKKLVHAIARIESKTRISADRVWSIIRITILMTEQQLSYRRLAT